MKFVILYLLVALTFVFASALPRRDPAHDEYADAFGDLSGEDTSSERRSDEYEEAY